MGFRHSARNGRCLGVLLLLVASCCTGVSAIGVNYGTLANDLPSPAQVVSLVQSTYISQVKIYDTNPGIISAFANTGISLVVGATNDEIAPLAASESFAQQWVTQNVASHYPSTKIICIVVGNEVLTTAPNSSYNLVPAMQNLHTGLTNLGLDGKIKVSTPHSFGVLGTSYPPSNGIFRTDLSGPIFAPMLDFLAQTGAPFMINVYPYFSYRDNPQISISYAMFEPYAAVVDSVTGLKYNNLFDAQVDAAYAAMAKLGHQDITVTVSETGWPSSGDPDELGVGMANAQTYMSNLLQHINANVGTPDRPGVGIDTYIFALFNENQKPGPTSERNFGLFLPDQSVVYNVGLVTESSPPPMESTTPPPPASSPPKSPAGSPPPPTPSSTPEPPAGSQPPAAPTPSSTPASTPPPPSTSVTPAPPFTAPPPPYPVPHVPPGGSTPSPPSVSTSPPPASSTPSPPPMSTSPPAASTPSPPPVSTSPPPAASTPSPPPVSTSPPAALTPSPPPVSTSPPASSSPPPKSTPPPPPSFFNPPPGTPSSSPPPASGTPPYLPSPPPSTASPPPASPPPSPPAPPESPPPSSPAPESPPPSSPAPGSPPPAPPAPTVPSPPATAPPGTPPAPPGTASGPNTWCVAKPGSPMDDLTNALNYACGEGGANCNQIQPGASCYNPNTLFSHASFAFSSYYAQNGRNYWNCFFGNSSLITITNPSYAGCTYP